MTEPPSKSSKFLARLLIVGLGLLAILAGIGLAHRPPERAPDFAAPANNTAS